ncbi:MAG: hypothetical protein WD009_13310 [Phycisphaeraceae bacterium]
MPDTTTIPTGPLEASSSNFRTAYVSVDPLMNKARLRPTLRVRLFAGAFLVFGILLLVLVLPSIARSEPWYWALLPGGIGTVFALIGVAGTCFGFGIGATFDRQSGIMHRRRRLVSFDSHALADVAALQVCSRWVPGDHDTRGYTTYELNIILHQPVQARFNLVSHKHGQALREDARKLDEFLDLPVLDGQATETEAQAL